VPLAERKTYISLASPYISLYLPTSPYISPTSHQVPLAERKTFYTAAGRPVQDGGGIP